MTHDAEDPLPSLLRDIERDVHDEARRAARLHFGPLVDRALAAAEGEGRAGSKARHSAWFIALATTAAVTTAFAMGVTVWRRTFDARRAHAVESIDATPSAPLGRSSSRRSSPPGPLESSVPVPGNDAGVLLPFGAPPPRRPRPSTLTQVAETPAALYLRANEARRARAHEAAVALYRRLLRAHPDAPESQQARVSLGRLLLDRGGDPNEAEALFSAYLRRDPRGIEAETAMAGRARALQRAGRSHEERAAWSALLVAYPDSVHAGEARRRLETP